MKPSLGLLIVAAFAAIFIPYKTVFIVPVAAQVSISQPVATAVASSSPSASQRAVNTILKEADRLVAKYGSLPPYNGSLLAQNKPLSYDQAVSVLPYLIACESNDRSVSEIDSNGLLSSGILQYQSWHSDWEKSSGLSGDPMVKYDSVMMGIWGLTHGRIGRWSCAGILGII